VMIKIGKPKGLIRFASYNSIKEGLQQVITGRVIGYSFVLLALLALLSFMIATRSDVETTVLKVPGTLYQKAEDGAITNLYTFEFVNKTFEDITLEPRVESPARAILYRVGEQAVTVPAGELLKSVYFIKIPRHDIASAKTVVEIGIFRVGEKIETVKAKFIGPIRSKEKHEEEEEHDDD
jgi:polyferredoxin